MEFSCEVSKLDLYRDRSIYKADIDVNSYKSASPDGVFTGNIHTFLAYGNANSQLWQIRFTLWQAQFTLWVTLFGREM